MITEIHTLPPHRVTPPWVWHIAVATAALSWWLIYRELQPLSA